MIFFKIILTQIYGPIIFFQSRPGADPDFLKRGGKQWDPNPNFPSFSKVFRQNGNLPSPVDCAPSPVLYNPVLKLASQLHRKYYFGQEEEEMKLCLMILSVPWYMFNRLEHNAILSNFLIFITGSSSRLLRIRMFAAITLYWFPVQGI